VTFNKQQRKQQTKTQQASTTVPNVLHAITIFFLSMSSKGRRRDINNYIITVVERW
jgi:hypothetical protein